MSNQQLAVSNQPAHTCICPHCLGEYTLGVDGVESGCDKCEGIFRNPVDNSIVDLNIDEETFIKRIS